MLNAEAIATYDLVEYEEAVEAYRRRWSYPGDPGSWRVEDMDSAANSVSKLTVHWHIYTFCG